MPFSMSIREDRCIMTRTAPDEGEDTVLTTITDSGPVQIDVNDITRFDITYEEDRVEQGRMRSYPCSFSATTARADREFLRRRLAVCRPDGGEPATE